MEQLCRATKFVEMDCAHRVVYHHSKCRHLHGHRYRIEATVIGPIKTGTKDSDEGMVMDFGDIKRILMTHIHDVYDHGAIFYVLDEHMQQASALLKELEPNMNINMVDFIPTAENLAKFFYEIVARELPAPMKLDNIRVFETPGSWADYNGGQ